MVKNDGSLWVTGANTFGQLGKNVNKYMAITNFAKVLSSDVMTVAAGDGHSMVLKQDGSLWSTGMNMNGQLGDGSNTDTDKLVRVIPPSRAKAVAAGAAHSMVLKQNGSVCVTGSNEHGQLGHRQKGNTNKFVKVSSDAIAIAAGTLHSMMLKVDGSVCATGQNDYGQLGHGHIGRRSRYAEVFGTCDISILFLSGFTYSSSSSQP